MEKIELTARELMCCAAIERVFFGSVIVFAPHEPRKQPDGMPAQRADFRTRHIALAVREADRALKHARPMRRPKRLVSDSIEAAAADASRGGVEQAVREIQGGAV